MRKHRAVLTTCYAAGTVNRKNSEPSVPQGWATFILLLHFVQ